MNTEDKYPHLSNADLAELLGLNRLLQFEKLPQRFKDMTAYVPYGHDLIELIQERLLSVSDAAARANTTTGTRAGLPAPNRKNCCTIDLTYYFTRNADLRVTLHTHFNQYGILLGRPSGDAVNEILEKIHDEGLIAKTVPGGPIYYLFASWDIESRGLMGDEIARSTFGDWVITEVSTKRII